MNKQLLITFSIWFTTTIFSFAQHESNLAYAENVEVHINTDFLITGETLYYSIMCLESQKNTPSSLSKVAYVELIGENEKPVFQTKISLTDGRGAGDFFLSSTLPSGNYTLIAYTKWMRNFPLEYFFKKQITIINPYLKPLTKEHGTEAKSTLSTHTSNLKIKNETNQVRLTSDKKQYSLRQKVVVVIKNNDPVHDCKISLNVHRYYKNLDTAAAGSTSPMTQQPEKKTGFVTLLPDLRGEIIGGSVKESISHQPLINTNIYLSAIGSAYFFQISRTDSVGRFYFSTKNIQTQTGIQFLVDRPSESSPVEVLLDDEFVNNYKNFTPLPFSVDTSVRRQIEQRNVYSQIENAYFVNKKDSILAPTQEPFFGTPNKVYKLDDFTRFPTMEDIFREYIYEVVVSKRDGKFALVLINSNSKNGSRFLNTPLMLIDGIPIFDTEILMNYNPLIVKQISLITRQYVYGGIQYDGILSISTYTGNAKDLPITTIQKTYTPWQHPKKYYSPMYNTHESLQRVPDYRVQLLWNPTISIEPGQEFIGEFYTSDIEGDFLIEVKGFNSNGEAVNLRESIEVRKQ